MASVSTGIDIGVSTVKLIRGEVKGTGFVATGFAVVPNPDGTVAGGWQALARSAVAKPANCRIGLTGKEINVRYTRVPRLPDWQLRKLMRFEAEEVGGQSDTRVASDFNVLPEIPEIEGEDVVLLAMARESLLAEHAAGLSVLGGKLDAFTPNAIGLYNAFLRYGVVMEDTVLIANIGHENIDVVLVRGADLLFARNMTGGSKLFDEALASRFEIDAKRAERYKVEEGTLESTGSFTDANQEKAARAMAAPAGQVLSLLQSATLFAKSQVKLSTLKLDRVLLCGGGAALEGLTRYLKEALGVPVEIFDPFEFVDTSKLDPATADLLDDHRMEAVAALGLATCGSDPEAYSIEILPEAVRKRRDFVTGPALLIAAAVLAMLYLGHFAFEESSRLDELTAEAATLERSFRRADSTHRQTATLIEENRRLEEFGHELFALKGSGEQMVRALTVLESSLPEDFWLETMTIAYGFDVDLGVERADERPIIRLRGRAREGTDSPTLLWEEYIAALKAGYPNARITQSMGQSDFTLALTVLQKEDPRPEGENEPAEEAQEGAVVMDLNDYWQENRRFVTTVGAGALVFLIALMVFKSMYEDDINAKSRVIGQRKTDLAQPMYDTSDLADARTENEALRAAVDQLLAATDFEPRSEFKLDPTLGSFSNQYLRSLARVRDELIPRANRANLQVDSQLGMPRLSPTRDEEIERYLEALDVIETVVGLSVDARVQRIDKIQIRLDPGLNSREGLGAIERTRVVFTMTGTSLALERVLAWTQRPKSGRVLHIDDVEMVPARSREDEVRLDLTIVIARLSEPVEEEV